MAKKSIPQELEAYIDRYFNLKISGKTVVCPYFMNSAAGFLRPPVQAGKGTPDQIEEEGAKIFSYIKNLDTSEEVIRQEMIDHGLGIDCSGLVYQLYNYWLTSILGKQTLDTYLPPQKTLNVRKIFSRKLKPESSVSADMFTSSPIAEKVSPLEALPGDLIRTKGGKHVLFVTDVEYIDEKATKIYYVQSTRFYARNGLHKGIIELGTDGDLMKSSWIDVTSDEEKNHTFDGFKESVNVNGVYRTIFPIR